MTYTDFSFIFTLCVFFFLVTDTLLANDLFSLPIAISSLAVILSTLAFWMSKEKS